MKQNQITKKSIEIKTIRATDDPKIGVIRHKLKTL